MAEATTCRLCPWGGLLMPGDFGCLPDWPSWRPETCKYHFWCESQNILIWKGSTRIIKSSCWPCTGHHNNPTLCLRADCCQPRAHSGDIPQCHLPPQCHGTAPSSGGAIRRGESSTGYRQPPSYSRGRSLLGGNQGDLATEVLLGDFPPVTQGQGHASG